ncbi:MAG: hypothetical protein ABIF40_03310 [archaeon]
MFDKIPFARGHRSMVYLINKHGKTFILKEERKDIQAFNRIKNEINWLKILNKKGIGPKFIEEGANSFICEYINGDRIIPWTEKNSKVKIKNMLTNVLNQCRELDLLKVNKLEMNYPYKHIMVDKKPVMIDFERMKKTPTPKNVTQFCQFIISNKYYRILEQKKFSFEPEELINLARDYKKDYSKKKFDKIINYLK